MTAWYEIVVSGAEDGLRGFVAACEASAGGGLGAVFGRDLDLEGSRLSSRLKELFAAGSHHFVFAPARLAGEILRALERGGKEAELDVESVGKITAARLPFAAKAFSAEAAAALKATLLAGLPPGVAVDGLVEEEERDPEAHGVELYTPEHEFTYRVEATFSGAMPGILEMRRRLGDVPFAKVHPLEVETEPLDASQFPE
jgi:hypothetical protein